MVVNDFVLVFFCGGGLEVGKKRRRRVDDMQVEVG